MFDSITHPKQRAFLVAFSDLGDVKAAALLADISRDVHYRWKHEDEEYAQAFKLAEEMAADFLEGEMHREARQLGDNFKARAFLLRGLKPERYSTKRIEKKAETTHTHTHRHRVDLTVLTDAELHQLIELTRKASPHRLVGGGRGTTVDVEAQEPAE